jgi:hypothetical protein
MNALKTKTCKVTLMAAAAVGLAGLTPITALAHDHHHDDVNVDIRIGDVPVRRWVPAVYEERTSRIWVEPVYRTVCDSVYDAPVFRTECERVWREPVVRTDCERVLVPDRYEWREVTVFDCGRPHLERRRVLVSAAHYEKIERTVVLAEGHWENVEHQVLVRDGGYRKIERQELVTPGHYETRCERVQVVAGHWETAVASTGFDLRFHN